MLVDEVKRRAALYYLHTRRAKRAAAAKAARMAQLAAKRQKRHRLLQVALLLAVLEDESMAAGLFKRVRRVINRARGSWEGSTLFGYLYNQDANAKEKVYRDNFRMSPKTFDQLASIIQRSAVAFVPRTGCVRGRKLKPVSFKLGACLYVLALGTCTKAAADCASVGTSTIELWLRQFADACFTVLKPVYMPSAPMAPELLQQVREEFSARRGINIAAMACDGSHVPFRTHHQDYRNYKSWYSTLLVAFVNSFYLFVDGTAGYPGRAGDNTVLRHSWLMNQITADPDAWLGPGGVILGDSGASDGDNLFLNPYPNPKTPQEFYFNFCHSSTRFFVEETFGRWKNRFRFLLHDHDMKHKLHSQLVYCTMILHNICTILKDDSVEFSVGSDAEWKAFFTKFKRDRCPSCVRGHIAHCSHTTRNRNRASASKTYPHRNKKPSEKRDLIAAELWQALCAGEHDLMPQAGDTSSWREQAQRQRATMHRRAQAGRVDRPGEVQ